MKHLKKLNKIFQLLINLPRGRINMSYSIPRKKEDKEDAESSNEEEETGDP